ncbi:MAG: hypothetical protein IV086_12330 [Hyphomonadaceae bacterium]|nr:hypothetical protein [Hyphomonadaceae bacterium]
MITFTLDTNCIIDLAENRSAAKAVRALSISSVEGHAQVAVVSVSASERQPGDSYLESYEDFKARLATVRLEHLEILPTISCWDIGFWGVGLFGGTTEMVARERLVHETLFPTIPFSWQDFAALTGISPQTIRLPEARRWRNAFCDRQMFWAHDHNRRDIFVTSDDNFRKRLSQSPAFSNARIATPDEAVQFLV